MERCPNKAYLLVLITIVADIFHTCTGLVDALQIKVKVSPGHT